MRVQVCKQCSRELALAKGFYKHSHYATGYMKTCKKCHRENVRINYELKFELRRETKRLWSCRPENVEKRKAYRATPQGREGHRASCRRYVRFRRMEGRLQ